MMKRRHRVAQQKNIECVFGPRFSFVFLILGSELELLKRGALCPRLSLDVLLLDF